MKETSPGTGAALGALDTSLPLRPYPGVCAQTGHSCATGPDRFTRANGRTSGKATGHRRSRWPARRWVASGKAPDRRGPSGFTRSARSSCRAIPTASRANTLRRPCRSRRLESWRAPRPYLDELAFKSEFPFRVWVGEFKQIVDVNVRESTHYYDRLVAVHDELRNPSARGEIHSDGTDFSFILPGVGPVHARLVMQKGRQRTYRWHGGGVDDILAELADVEQWLRTGPLGSAVQYGESDLSLFFGGDLRTELAASAHDPDALKELIDRLQWLVDSHANMDW